MRARLLSLRDGAGNLQVYKVFAVYDAWLSHRLHDMLLVGHGLYEAVRADEFKDRAFRWREFVRKAFLEQTGLCHRITKPIQGGSLLAHSKDTAQDKEDQWAKL